MTEQTGESKEGRNPRRQRPRKELDFWQWQLARRFPYIFTALHGMPARTSYEKGVCLSVCQTRELW